MDATIWVALISFAGTAVGAIAGVTINTKLSNYRIEQLEKKVEKHNQLGEKIYEVEKDVQEIKTDIKHIYHEIDEIKK